MDKQSQSPIPTWSSKNHRNDTVTLPIDGVTNILPWSIPVRINDASWGYQENNLRDINFIWYIWIMEIQRDTSGNVSAIIFWEHVKKVERVKEDRDLPEYGGHNSLKEYSSMIPTEKKPDRLLELVNLLVEQVHNKPPQIIPISPNYSTWFDRYRTDTPSNAIVWHIISQESSLDRLNSPAGIKKSPKDILLEQIQSIDREWNSWHPFLRNYIIKNIDTITDSQGNFITEKVYWEFLKCAPSEIRIMLCSFFRMYIPDNEYDSVITRVLFEYSCDGNYFPYWEIWRNIEEIEDIEKLLIALVSSIRRIPPNVRISFLQLFNEDPIVDKLREKIRAALHFENKAILSLQELPSTLRDNFLKHITWFELSDWCSVGCSFCSVDAPRKKPKELIHFPISDIILLWAQYGKNFNPTFYYASDPLDWEGKLWNMELHYFDLHSLHLLLTGNHGFVSTAVPKHKMKLAIEYVDMIDRISVSFWNEKRVWDAWINQTWLGLIYARRSIGTAETKVITWHGIPPERTNRAPVENDVNAWFPSCDSWLMISPNSTMLSNLTNLEKRDLTHAPQWYFVTNINPLTPKYLSQALTYGKHAWDLSVLQDLMAGSILLPEHTSAVIQRKTKQAFWEWSFLLRVLWFDWQERKYAFVYKYEWKSSALVYITPQMYEDIYFTNTLGRIQNKSNLELVPSGPVLTNLTANQVIDGINTDQRNDILNFLADDNSKNFDNCCFKVQEAKNLIENLIKDQGPREDAQCIVTEKLIRVIMFTEEVFDIPATLKWLQFLRNNNVLITAIKYQMDAAIERFTKLLKTNMR